MWVRRHYMASLVLAGSPVYSKRPGRRWAYQYPPMTLPYIWANVQPLEWLLYNLNIDTRLQKQMDPRQGKLGTTEEEGEEGTHWEERDLGSGRLNGRLMGLLHLLLQPPNPTQPRLFGREIFQEVKESGTISTARCSRRRTSVQSRIQSIWPMQLRAHILGTLWTHSGGYLVGVASTSLQ